MAQKIFVFIDTEYKDSQVLSLQVYLRVERDDAIHEALFIVLAHELSSYNAPSFDFLNIPVDMYYSTFFEKDHVLLNELSKYLDKWGCIPVADSNSSDQKPSNPFKINIQVYYFYQIRDLSIAFGPANMEPYYSNNKPGLIIRRTVTGSLKEEFIYKGLIINYVVAVHDISGLENGSLADLMLSCGILQSSKNLMDKYKSNMFEGFKKETSLFLEYAIGDAYYLYAILDSKVTLFNKMMVDIYKLPQQFLFEKHTIPLTIGAIINYIWESYYEYVLLKYRSDFKLAFAKQSILNQSSTTYTANLDSFKALSNFKSLSELTNSDPNTGSLVLTEDVKPLKGLLVKDALEFGPHQYGSIRYLISYSKNTSSIYNTLRTGGRSVNELPTECFVKHVLDVDISQAYGTELLRGVLPIGRPVIYATASNQKGITLGEFLEKNERYFNKHKLFKIVVSGKLKEASCDLLLSKIASPTKFQNLIKKFNPLVPGTAEFASETVLLRKEFVNATITSSLLEIIRNIATNKEKNEFFNLKVITAMYWNDHEAVDSIDDLAEKFLADTGVAEYDQNMQCLKDTRTNAWYPFKLSDFIGPLVKERSRLKPLPEIENKAYSNSLKLAINTFYGIITSVFFDINNVVVSDIITSNIRSAAWLLAKALRTRVIITDGGFFTPTEVYYLRLNENTKKPGITVFSKYANMDNHKSLYKAPLPGINNPSIVSFDWVSFFENKLNPSILFPKSENNKPKPYPSVDDIIINHVRQFWAAYKIDYYWGLEVKPDNVSLKASYFLKTHYMFLRWNSETKDYTNLLKKIRGVRTRDIEAKLYVNPMFYLLKAMLMQQTNFKYNFIYETSGLFSLAQYRATLIKPKSNLPYTSTSNLMPGDYFVKESQFRLNNTHCYIDYFKDYNTRCTRANAKIKMYNPITNQAEIYSYILFEILFFIKSIAEVIKILNNNVHFRTLAKDRKAAQIPLNESISWFYLYKKEYIKIENLTTTCYDFSTVDFQDIAAKVKEFKLRAQSTPNNLKGIMDELGISSQLLEQSMDSETSDTEI